MPLICKAPRESTAGAAAIGANAMAAVPLGGKGTDCVQPRIRGVVTKRHKVGVLAKGDGISSVRVAPCQGRRPYLEGVEARQRRGRK